MLLSVLMRERNMPAMRVQMRTLPVVSILAMAMVTCLATVKCLAVVRIPATVELEFHIAMLEPQDMSSTRENLSISLLHVHKFGFLAVPPGLSHLYGDMAMAPSNSRTTEQLEIGEADILREEGPLVNQVPHLDTLLKQRSFSLI